MAKPRLHLDADASRKDLYEALLAKGHDITRTPTLGLPFDASDEFQLLWAAAHERVLFTFNVRDFLQLTSRIPEHKGVVLASQRSFSLGELITAIDRMLHETEAEDWPGKVRWLSDWR
jgi:hypothetical protein